MSSLQNSHTKSHRLMPSYRCKWDQHTEILYVGNTLLHNTLVCSQFENIPHYNHKAFYTTKQYHKPPLTPKNRQRHKNNFLETTKSRRVHYEGESRIVVIALSSSCAYACFCFPYNTLNPKSNNKIFNY